MTAALEVTYISIAWSLGTLYNSNTVTCMLV